MFRAINKDLPIPQDFLSDLDWGHNYSTRKVQTLKLPRIKHESDKNFFIYNLALLWNSLDIAGEVHNFTSVASFKKACKAEILSKQK